METLQGADLVHVRQENRNADGDLMGWPEFELHWRNQRGRPNDVGRIVLVIAGLAAAFVAASTLVHFAINLRLISNLAIAAGICFIAFGGVALVPGLHHSVTVEWTLAVSPWSIRLDENRESSARASQEIRRIDAGRLDVALTEGGPGRRKGPPMLASAMGTSIDGRTRISLPSRSVAGSGRLGILFRIPLAVVLISWWPVNSMSIPGLLEYQRCSSTYWYPDGVPPRPRGDLREAD